MNIFRFSSLFLLLCLVVIAGYGQESSTNLTLKGYRLTIKENSSVTVNGNVQVMQNSDGDENVHNEGRLYLSDTLINLVENLFLSSTNPVLSGDGADQDNQDPMGRYVFGSDNAKYVTGKPSVYFYNLTVQEGELKIDTNLTVLGEIELDQGNIDLDGDTVFLYDLSEQINIHTGRLKAGTESADFRVYDEDSTGTIKAYIIADGREEGDASNLGFGIFPRGSLGTVFLTRSHNSDTLVTDGSIEKGYLIAPGDESSALGSAVESVRFSFLESDLPDHLSGNDSTIRLFRKNQAGTRYFYLGGSAEAAGSAVNAEDINLNAGYYTIADSICTNPPLVNLGEDTTVCQNSRIVLVADTLYSAEKEPAMRYRWWSPDFVIENDEDLRDGVLEIHEDTINQHLDETLTVYLEVTDERGCFNRDTLQIRTYPNPHIGFKVLSDKAYICLGDTVTFTDTLNTTGSYVWSLGEDSKTNSNPDFIFNNRSGSEELSVLYTNNNGCTSDTTVSLTVHSVPEPVFTVDAESCLGQTLNLENISRLDRENGGAISKYTWNMGNGNCIEVTPDEVTSDGSEWYASDTIAHSGGVPGPDLFYQYNQTGSYDIKLVAETFSGCVGDSTLTTHVYDSVHAAFNTSDYTDVCLGMESQFFPAVETSGADLVSEYQWHFPDATVTAYSLTDTIRYTFANAGSHEVKLVAVSPNGCSDTATRSVHIRQAPVASFTVEPVCLNTTSVFNSTGSSTDATEYSWRINGEEIYSMPGDPVHYMFPDTGKHTVELSVKHDNGCKDTYIDSAVVLGNPEASFTVADVCVNEQATDQLIVNDSENLPSVVYHWDFGDNTTTEMAQPAKSYVEPGQYHVRLQASLEYANYGVTCKSESTNTVEVFDIAPASFEVGKSTNVCLGNQSVFLPDNLTNTTLIEQYEWSIDGDNITTTEPESVHYQFSNAGRFEVSLRTKTHAGCIDEVSHEVEIYEVPEATIVSDSVCAGEELAFGLANATGEMATQYQWYIQGEPMGTGQYVSVLNDMPGTYEVTLEMESENGCTSRDTNYAVVHALPEDMFQDGIRICSDSLQLTGNNGFTYLWNNSVLADSYTVYHDQLCEVVVTDDVTGCQTEERIQIELNQPLQVDLGNDTEVCGGITLDAGYFGQSADYLWSNGETGRYLEVAHSGEYSVTVQQGGCSDSDTIQVTVHEIPVLDLGDDMQACVGQSVTLDAAMPQGVDYAWSNGHTAESINITSEVAGTSRYKVTVTDVNQCRVSDEVNVTFHPLPELDLGPDIETCQDNPVTLNATIADAASYSWNTGATTSFIELSENSSEVTERNYHVHVTNRYGCTSADTIGVRFNPVPEVALPEDVTACGNEDIVLSAYTPGVVSYLWNNGAVDPEITLNAHEHGDGVYYVQAENQYGCVGTSNQARVAFNDAPVGIMPEEVTGCNRVTLDAGNFGARYLWDNGLTTRSREVYESGLYTVTITNGNNCSIVDTVSATVNYVTKPYLGPDVQLCENDQKVLRTGIHDSQYSFEWNGYSTGDTMLVATPGTYIVKAMHNNGCEDADTINVIGRPRPDVNLGPDMYKCTDENIILDAGDEGISYLWGTSSGVHAGERLYEVADTGYYWVEVVNDYGCTRQDTVQIKPTSMSIDPLFVTNSRLVAGDSVLFVDMSQPEPLNWLWDFGDLQQSVFQNPVHVYYRGGSYQVTLHVSNSVCNASVVKIIEVDNRKDKGEEDDQDEFFGNKFVEIREVIVYPNPNTGNFTIEAELSARTNVQVYIFDLMGRLVSVSKYDNIDVLNEYVDIQSKSSGIYVIKIIAGTDQKTYKVIKE